ncbi:hypothetical protein PR202_gb27037 [Eleusine coracana subsp. coracana]|uniref:Uncharacterized protein n=1 Tax=Eleusine coracana subsp. coracana TaxID=191504 RepID=A0AAV5FT59_ELECO|nr:hypothetical protein PR202_gb27037 [Eleusine coracana subsp. coracana]
MAKSSSPRAVAGGGEHYSPSSKTPRGGAGSKPGSAAWLVDSKWALSAALSLLLLLAAGLAMTSTSSSSYISASSFFSFLPSGHQADFVEAHVHVNNGGAAAAQPTTNANASSSPPPPPPGSGLPRLAYLISGSKGDLDRLWRTLHALYHPRNQYVVHLDREAPVGERLQLAARVAGSAVFRRAGNVHVIRRANMVTYRGPTMVANTLHACAVLLRRGGQWDWFINLSASDYPLMTQDDILHVFSTVPRNVNFVEHTGYLGWKEGQRAKPLIVDPGLYKSTKQDIFWVTQKRELPTAFKLFTGSAWVGLTRDFVEYCVWGWDNLPRTLLMYYANFVSGTCVPPRQHPHALALPDLPRMVASGAPFARKFPRDDPVLDAIDADILHRAHSSSPPPPPSSSSSHPPIANNNGTTAAAMAFVPGGWCGEDANCREVDNDWVLRPGPGADRLQRLMDRIVRSEAFANSQCK